MKYLVMKGRINDLERCFPHLKGLFSANGISGDE